MGEADREEHPRRFLCGGDDAGRSM